MQSNLIRSIFALWLMGFTLPLFAQQVDMENIDREIKVAENVLSSLLKETFKSENGMAMLGGSAHSVKGSYLNDFGVLFNIAAPNLMNNHYWHWSDGNPGAIIIDGRRKGTYRYRYNSDDCDNCDEKEEEREKERDEEEEDNNEELLSVMEDKFRAFIHLFVKDYAFMLRSVPESEKIVIKMSIGNHILVGSGSWQGNIRHSGATISATIKKSDILAYQKDQISEEALMESIVFVGEKGEDENEAENRNFEIIASIFEKLYPTHSGKPFRMYGRPSYEKVEGLGVIFYLNLGSRFNFDFDFNFNFDVEPFVIDLERLNSDNLTEDKKKELEKEIEEKAQAFKEKAEKLKDKNLAVVKMIEEEQNPEKLDSAYNDFLAELKQNIVEYTSFVKDLAPDEGLIFKIQLPKCEGCNVMPEKLEIIAKQPVLEGYRKGTITLEDAVKQLMVDR